MHQLSLSTANTIPLRFLPRYEIPREDICVRFHYLPTFYHLHLHFEVRQKCECVQQRAAYEIYQRLLSIILLQSHVLCYFRSDVQRSDGKATDTEFSMKSSAC